MSKWQPIPQTGRKVGDTVKSVANLSGITSGPIPAALISGGAGALAGLALSPAVKYLYPEMSRAKSKNIGLLTGAATGLSAAGLSYALAKARRENMARQKRAYYPGGLPGGGVPRPQGFSADTNAIRKDYLIAATNPLIRRGTVGPIIGGAFQNTVMNSSYGNTANQSQLNNQAKHNGFMSAVGGYLNPVNRLGFAMAGAGAQLMTNALGMQDKAKNVLGMPVSQAARTYLPGAKLLTTGLGMLGGRQ